MATKRDKVGESIPYTPTIRGGSGTHFSHAEWGGVLTKILEVVLTQGTLRFSHTREGDRQCLPCLSGGWRKKYKTRDLPIF